MSEALVNASGTKIYTLSDCLVSSNDNNLVFPSGVTWGNIDKLCGVWVSLGDATRGLYKVGSTLYKVTNGYQQTAVISNSATSISIDGIGTALVDLIIVMK